MSDLTARLLAKAAAVPWDIDGAAELRARDILATPAGAALAELVEAAVAWQGWDRGDIDDALGVQVIDALFVAVEAAQEAGR